MNPILAVGALLGHGTPITDLFLQVKLNGNMAVMRGIMKHLLEADEKAPGAAVRGSLHGLYTAS